MSGRGAGLNGDFRFFEQFDHRRIQFGADVPDDGRFRRNGVGDAGLAQLAGQKRRCFMLLEAQSIGLIVPNSTRLSRSECGGFRMNCRSRKTMSDDARRSLGVCIYY